MIASSILLRDSLISILNDDKSRSYLIIDAMFKLMNIADKISLNVISNVLKSHSCELVRHEAAFCLGEMMSDDTVEVLKESLINDVSIIVKHECLMSLGTIANFEDLVLIEEYLNDDREEILSSAKICIERINQKNIFEINIKNRDKYISLLLDSLNTVRNDRIQIIFQLMRLADNKSIVALYDCLVNDPCSIVRHEAAFVLGEIGSDKSCNYLEKAIKFEKNSVVIHEALFALGTSAKVKVIPFLKKYIDDKNYLISQSAKIAIDRINLIDEPYSGRNEFL